MNIKLPLSWARSEPSIYVDIIDADYRCIARVKEEIAELFIRSVNAEEAHQKLVDEGWEALFGLPREERQCRTDLRKALESSEKALKGEQ